MIREWPLTGSVMVLAAYIPIPRLMTVDSVQFSV